MSFQQNVIVKSLIDLQKQQIELIFFFIFKFNLIFLTYFCYKIFKSLFIIYFID